MQHHSRTPAAGVLAAALVLACTGHASARVAAPGCAETWDALWICQHHVGARVHEAPNRNSPTIGSLPGNSSWFRCRTEAGWHGSGPHKYRWLELDEGGWVADGSIISETNPVVVC